MSSSSSSSSLSPIREYIPEGKRVIVTTSYAPFYLAYTHTKECVSHDYDILMFYYDVISKLRKSRLVLRSFVINIPSTYNFQLADHALVYMMKKSLIRSRELNNDQETRYSRRIIQARSNMDDAIQGAADHRLCVLCQWYSDTMDTNIAYVTSLNKCDNHIRDLYTIDQQLTGSIVSRNASPLVYVLLPVRTVADIVLRFVASAYFEQDSSVLTLGSSENTQSV